MTDSNKSQLVDLGNIANALNSDVVMRTYEDGLTESVKEAGGLLSDMIKTLRLIGLPLQLTAIGQDKFRRWLDEVVESVPEERRVPVKPAIAVPLLRNVALLEDEDQILAEMYAELLRRAIDSSTVDNSRPRYVALIEQLSPEEAVFLRDIRDGKITGSMTQDGPLHSNPNLVAVNFEGGSSSMSSPSSYVAQNTYFSRHEDLNQREAVIDRTHYKIFADHLVSLAILEWRIKSVDSSSFGDRQETHSKLALSALGEDFCDRCLAR